MNILLSVRKIILVLFGAGLGYLSTLIIASWLIKSGIAWGLLKGQLEELPEQEFQVQIMEIISSGRNIDSICIGDEQFAVEFCEKKIKETYDLISLSSINRKVVTKLIQNAGAIKIQGNIYVQTPVWFWTDVADNEFSLNYDFEMVHQVLSTRQYELKNLTILVDYLEKSLGQLFDLGSKKNVEKTPVSFINTSYEFPLIKQKYYWNTIRYYSKSSWADRIIWVGSKRWLPENYPTEIKKGYADFLSLKSFELGLVHEIGQTDR